MTQKPKQKWTKVQLISRMLAAGWQPQPEPGRWSHPDGVAIDLNAPMRDGIEYWHQLAERNVLPPSAPVPF